MKELLCQTCVLPACSYGCIVWSSAWCDSEQDSTREGRDSTREVQRLAKITPRDCLRQRRWNVTWCGSWGKLPSIIYPVSSSVASWFAPNQSALVCIQWRDDPGPTNSSGTKQAISFSCRCTKPRMKPAKAENREIGILPTDTGAQLTNLRATQIWYLHSQITVNHNNHYCTE